MFAVFVSMRPEWQVLLWSSVVPEATPASWAFAGHQSLPWISTTALEPRGGGGTIQRSGGRHTVSLSLLGRFENDAQLLEFVICHRVTESVSRNKPFLLSRSSLL